MEKRISICSSVLFINKIKLMYVVVLLVGGRRDIFNYGGIYLFNNGIFIFINCNGCLMMFF